MTYSNSLAVSRQHYASRHHNSVSFRAKERTLGPVSNTVILIVLACLLGLLYLTQVTKTNAYGYTISDLKQTQTELQAQHDDLEVTSARLQSLERVKDSKVASNLQSITPSGTINE